MKASAARILCLCFCLVAVHGIRAQSAPPPPTPSGGASGPGGPGGHNGPGGQGPSQHDGPRPPRDDQHRSPDGSRQPNSAASEKAGGQARNNALQLGPVGRWWDDKSVVDNIGITRQQQTKMDSIFNANRPAIVNSYKAYLKAQDNLQTVNKAAHPDQSQVFAAIDAVNQARSDLQKAASAMLLQIRSEMNPDQIDKLEMLQ